MTQFYLIGHSGSAQGMYEPGKHQEEFPRSWSWMSSVLCFCLHACMHLVTLFAFCPPVLQKGAGRFLHRLLVPNWAQHALCLPGQDTHPGETAGPQHSQHAQLVHCFGWWFYMKMPHFCTFLHCIASRSNVRTLPGSPKVLFLITRWRVVNICFWTVDFLHP